MLALATLSTFLLCFSFLFLCLILHNMCSCSVHIILLILDTFRSGISLIPKKCLTELLPTSPFEI